MSQQQQQQQQQKQQQHLIGFNSTDSTAEDEELTTAVDVEVAYVVSR